MSIVFSDTSAYKGLVQLYEREIGVELGFISGNTVRLKQFTADANIAMDRMAALAFKADGTWQYDDSNHTDYPIITTALVDGQRDYSFTTDEDSNLILDIYKVLVKNAAGTYYEVYPVDQQTDVDMESFFDGQNFEGSPYRYDKTANGIFLDPIPSYNSAAGLKIYVNREPSYFTYTDTTKKAGISGLYHRYLYLVPARDYARIHTLQSFDRLNAECVLLERDIEKNFSKRERDVVPRMTPPPICSI